MSITNNTLSKANSNTLRGGYRQSQEQLWPLLLPDLLWQKDGDVCIYAITRGVINFIFYCFVLILWQDFAV